MCFLRLPSFFGVMSLTVLAMQTLTAQSSPNMGSLNMGSALFETLAPATVPIRMSSDNAVEAYKLAVTYDPREVRISDVNLDGTSFGDLAEGVLKKLIRGMLELGISHSSKNLNIPLPVKMGKPKPLIWEEVA